LAQENRNPAGTLLVLTSDKGLRSSLDEAGAERAYAHIDRMAALKREAGLEVHVYVPDEPQRSSGAFPALDGGLTATAVRDGLAEVEKAVCPSGHLDYVLIVGGGEIVPVWHIPNPAADSDGEFPSDAPYATAGGGGIDDFLLPDRAVARIPSNAGPGGGLLGYLEALVPEGPRGPVRQRHFGLSALEWKAESARVYGVIASGGLKTSPPVDVSGFVPGWLQGQALIYFNVHGSREEKYWYGQDGSSYPKVLSPQVVAAAAPADAVVLSEACYGGLVEGKTADDSVAVSFLAGGVAAFVGSSAIAYGSPGENLTEADLFAHLFFSRLVAGETAGRAFREAKIDFAAEMLERQGYLDGDDRKTLLEFNLFGDPAVGILSGGGPEGGRRDMVSREVLASIVKVARDRFPEMEGVEPEISEQTETVAGAVARKVAKLRPASGAKGGPRSPGRVFVATFRQTIDAGGRRVERVVRVTFHESGRVIKVVSSK